MVSVPVFGKLLRCTQAQLITQELNCHIMVILFSMNCLTSSLANPKKNQLATTFDSCKSE